MTDMNTLTFDTLKFANRLKAAGMEPRLAEEQAVVMAEVFEAHLKELATREDLKRLEASLSERFDSRLLLLEQRMTIKLGALMVAAVGLVATLVKLL